MKIHVNCRQCQGSVRTHPLTADSSWIEVGDLTDEGLGTGMCPAGHTVSALVSSPLYVLLFDSGCLALLGGSYREAIGSFAASLERFYEFAVRVVLLHQRCAPETLDDILRGISRRSEQQFGAFHVLYSAHVGKPLPRWEHEALRNSVVHSGLLPTSSQAWTFAEDTYARIVDITKELKRTAAEALRQAQSMEFGKRIARRRTRLAYPLVTICSGSSPVAPDRIWDNAPSFRMALDLLEGFPMWIHPADRLSIGQVARDANLSVHEVYTLAKTGQLAPHLKRAIEKRRAQARGFRSIDRLLRQRRPTTL